MNLWRRMLIPVLLALTASLQACANQAGPEATRAMTGDSTNPDCRWECLQWSRDCDVDPRGVRECRRRCRQFGEYCEPPPDPDTK